MFGVLKPTDLRETKMRQISDCLPAWLTDEVNARAAAATNSAAQIEGGGPTPGRSRISPPTLYADAPAPSGSRVKGRGAKPRQVQNRGWARSREGDDARTVNAPVLVLVVDNGWRRDYRRPKGSPSPALRHPLSVVGGHQRTIPS
jgi:hypothetical protein